MARGCRDTSSEAGPACTAASLSSVRTCGHVPLAGPQPAHLPPAPSSCTAMTHAPSDPGWQKMRSRSASESTVSQATPRPRSCLPRTWCVACWPRCWARRWPPLACGPAPGGPPPATLYCWSTGWAVRLRWSCTSSPTRRYRRWLRSTRCGGGSMWRAVLGDRWFGGLEHGAWWRQQV